MRIEDIIFCKHYMNRAMEGKAIRDVANSMAIIRKKFSGSIDTIFDIGANVGIYSTLLSVWNPSSKVYSFEPVRANYDILVKNIAQNNLKNVFCYNFGFQKNDSQILMGIPEDRESENVGLYTCKCKSKIKDTVSCDMKNLSRWVNDNNISSIDLVKIDAEGSEYDIFSSSEDVLSIIKFIHIEMNESFDEYKLIESIFEKNNFKFLETSRKANQIWFNSSHF